MERGYVVIQHFCRSQYAVARRGGAFESPPGRSSKRVSKSATSTTSRACPNARAARLSTGRHAQVTAQSARAAALHRTSGASTSRRPEPDPRPSPPMRSRALRRQRPRQLSSSVSSNAFVNSSSAGCLAATKKAACRTMGTTARRPRLFPMALSSHRRCLLAMPRVQVSFSRNRPVASTRTAVAAASRPASPPRSPGARKG
jgi:hypothetical protein